MGNNTNVILAQGMASCVPNTFRSVLGAKGSVHSSLRLRRSVW